MYSNPPHVEQKMISHYLNRNSQLFFWGIAIIYIYIHICIYVYRESERERDVFVFVFVVVVVFVASTVPWCETTTFGVDDNDSDDDGGNMIIALMNITGIMGLDSR